LICFSGFSQSPDQAAGIRVGLSPGFEYRVFDSQLSSYKVLLSARQQGLQLTGMREFHVPGAFDFLPELSLIYGFGVHVGFESWYRYANDYRYSPPVSFRERRSGFIAGLDGLAAVEYPIPQIPLVVGAEVKPYFNLFGENFIQFRPFDFALTIKYTF
jgi:hypothetical protein